MKGMWLGAFGVILAYGSAEAGTRMRDPGSYCLRGLVLG
jgi:hypothetical protein